ncbi:hypothetical protein ACHAXT_010965 [Thalassiosira profunda]
MATKEYHWLQRTDGEWTEVEVTCNGPDGGPPGEVTCNGPELEAEIARDDSDSEVEVAGNGSKALITPAPRRATAADDGDEEVAAALLTFKRSDSNMSNTYNPSSLRTYFSFDDRLRQLAAYKRRHGHTQVREREDRSLYRFCKGARAARKQTGKKDMKLNAERIAKLNALGFDWRSLPPQGGNSGKSPREGSEVIRRRHVRTESDIAREYGRRAPKQRTVQVRRPENAAKPSTAAGDNKRGTPCSFYQRVEQLRAFQAEHGHLNVSAADDKSLAKFCINVRHALRKPENRTVKLTADRKAALDALGFDWRRQNWKKGAAASSAAAAEKERRASPKKKSKAPTKAKAKKEKAPAKKKGTKAKAKAPVKISTAAAFNIRVEQLKAFKAKYGHLNPTANAENSKEEKSLYHFCKRARAGRRNPESDKNLKMTADRIAALDAIGFEWGAGAKRTKKKREYHRPSNCELVAQQLHKESPNYRSAPPGYPEPPLY